MNTYRLLVKQGKKVKRQGTAWFVRPDVVVTAFHVVGDQTSRAWDSEEDPTICYELLAGIGGAPISLRSDLCDLQADVALLCSTDAVPAVSILPLSSIAVREEATWRSEGYPIGESGKPFALSGRVTKIWDRDPSEALQLFVRERTGAELRGESVWAGMSGAPVTVEGKVVGLVTKINPYADTAWAAPVAVIRDLALASVCRDLLVTHYKTEEQLRQLMTDLHWDGVEIGSAATPEKTAEQIARHASQNNAHNLHTLLEKIQKDYPDSRDAIRNILEVIHPPGVPQEALPKANPQRFAVAVTHLDNDPDQEHEHLLVEALQEEEDIQILRFDRTIPLDGPQPQERVKAGHDQARAYLEESGAQVLIWGTVLTAKTHSLPKLHWTPARHLELKKKFDRYQLTEDLNLPSVFWSDLGDILRLLVISYGAEFHAQKGHFIADKLSPFIEKVRRLVNGGEGQERWNAETRVNIQFILAGSLQTLGEQTGKGEPLEEAVRAYGEVLEEWTRERVPLQWAMTQNNLGERAEELRRAGSRHPTPARRGHGLSGSPGRAHPGAGALGLGNDPEQPGERTANTWGAEAGRSPGL